MRLGRLSIQRIHPSERALQKWGQLTPELRELVARAARSIAKDAVQDVVEAQGHPFRNFDPTRRPTNEDGTPFTDWQMSKAAPCELHSDGCPPGCARRCHSTLHAHYQWGVDLTPTQRAVAQQAVENAYGLLRSNPTEAQKVAALDAIKNQGYSKRNATDPTLVEEFNVPIRRVEEDE